MAGQPADPAPGCLVRRAKERRSKSAAREQATFQRCRMRPQATYCSRGDRSCVVNPVYGLHTNGHYYPMAVARCAGGGELQTAVDKGKGSTITQGPQSAIDTSSQVTATRDSASVTTGLSGLAGRPSTRYDRRRAGTSPTSSAMHAPTRLVPPACAPSPCVRVRLLSLRSRPALPDGRTRGLGGMVYEGAMSSLVRC